ncbi:hypothetical protein FLK61_24180 [Paenalkalicoccus suaedae]|uniref:Uncharacterized protein n=2 Tax=Paenalkalicoccus suaedae TaxID=2592382 RepID=A0A859FCD6_9BACI|nr:hypothetical protein FLK61_24180 [Paenalkalicoccus suaedae]
MPIKIITIILSSLIFSLSLALLGRSGTASPADISLITSFSYALVPSFLLYTIFGGMLTPVVDRFIYKRFRHSLKYIIISSILLYLALGLLTNIFLSILSASMFFFASGIFICIAAALLFLIVQTVIGWIFLNMRTNRKAPS